MPANAQSTQRAEAADGRTLHLQVLLPTGILVDEQVSKIVAEAEDGEFCLLPRHIDFVAALAPGILYFADRHGQPRYAALDHGILVKSGQEVYVSTFNGTQGSDIERLQSQLEERFLQLDEHERKTRRALARLEAGTLRGFRNLQARTGD